MKKKRENYSNVRKNNKKAMIEYCASAKINVKREHCLQSFSSLFELYKTGFDDIEIIEAVKNHYNASLDFTCNVVSLQFCVY